MSYKRQYKKTLSNCVIADTNVGGNEMEANGKAQETIKLCVITVWCQFPMKLRSRSTVFAGQCGQIAFLSSRCFSKMSIGYISDKRKLTETIPQLRRCSASEASPSECSPMHSDVWGRSRTLPGLPDLLLSVSFSQSFPGCPSYLLHGGNCLHFPLTSPKHRRKAFALYIPCDLLFPCHSPSTPFSCAHVFKREQNDYDMCPHYSKTPALLPLCNHPLCVVTHRWLP